MPASVLKSCHSLSKRLPSIGIVLVSIAIALARYSVAGAAATENVLYDGTLSIGQDLLAPVIQASNGNFYTVAAQGGAYGSGSLLQVLPTGGAALIYSFTGGTTDGGGPTAVIQGSDGDLYGTAGNGAHDQGTIFKLTLAGGFVWAYSLTAATGSVNAGLMQSTDGNFYGTTAGGSQGCGSVFKITASGVFTVLYTFPNGSGGCAPIGAPVEANDGNLYGINAGSNGTGLIYRMTTSGAYTTLHTFNGVTDGEYPGAGLIQGGDGRLYGTTSQNGGTGGGGTVFAMALAGSFTTLHTFAYGSAADGSGSVAPLIQLPDGNYYGTTKSGGAAGDGTIFGVSASGEEQLLFSFGGADGAAPVAGLTLGRDGYVYGTTQSGGGVRPGVAFNFSALSLESGLAPAGTDGPIPLWALGALSASLVGIASRRLKKHAQR
jgi:uncharacterized repeat protein (TIGR03803 family)